MIDRIQETEARWPVVELLLCAADLARVGYTAPLTEAFFRIYDNSQWAQFLATDARYEALAVSPHVFSYRGELMAETLTEAAYRVAEGRGACDSTPIAEAA